jgi:hypothetical protein
LYLMRIALAPSGTLQGLRQMVLDAAPVPATVRDRRAFNAFLSGEADGQETSQPVTTFRTKKDAFLAHYRSHPEYGNRSAAGRVAAELAPLAGLQAGTGRTYIAEELRKITDLTVHRSSAEDDDDQPAG